MPQIISGVIYRMSEYIHEVVLQDYIIENIIYLNLTVQFGGFSRMKLVEALSNSTKTFWDLSGKLEDGSWIPIEVEWTTSNFIQHKHNQSADFQKFISGNGVLLVLRKTKELPNIQQISILDSLSEAQFKKEFKAWFKKKSSEYIDKTLKMYMVGAYKRELPRIILYPLSKYARENYFPNGMLYRKNNVGPALIGFKPAGHKKNVFIRDLQPDDVILFIASDGTRCKRADFIDRIKSGRLKVDRLVGYRIRQGITNKCANNLGIDMEYWPDEIRMHQMIYQYICVLEDHPFIDKTDIAFPFLKAYSDSTWEAFRSCIQYGEYREISPLDFTLFVSSL